MTLPLPRAERDRVAQGGIALAEGQPQGGVVLEQGFPVIVVHGGDLGVFQDQDVVALGAQPRRGPVGRAGEHRPGGARGVQVDDELVVADVIALGQQVVVQVGAQELAQLLARGGVGAVVDRYRFARHRLAGVGVGQNDLDKSLRLLQGRDQLRVGQLIQGAQALAPFARRAPEQAGQRLVGFARQTLADRVSRGADMLAQRRGAGRAALAPGQLAAQRLGGDDAAVEHHALPAQRVGGLDRVGAHLEPGDLDQLLPGRPADRDDLVFDRGLLGDEQVLPLVGLDGPIVGVRALLFGPLFRRAEAHERGQRRGLLACLDAVDGEPQATGDLFRIGPPQIDQVVVGDRQRLFFHKISPPMEGNQ